MAFEKFDLMICATGNFKVCLKGFLIVPGLKVVQMICSCIG